MNIQKMIAPLYGVRTVDEIVAPIKSTIAQLEQAVESREKLIDQNVEQIEKLKNQNSEHYEEVARAERIRTNLSNLINA